MVLVRGIAGFLFPRLFACMYMGTCVGTQGSQSRREQGLLAAGILSVRVKRSLHGDTSYGRGAGVDIACTPSLSRRILGGEARAFCNTQVVKRSLISNY